MKKKYILHHGDCLDHLEFMADNSVDSIVCDPPYGYKFMGKRWDYEVPSVEKWAECLRVLKPGGHLLSFGGSRTYHRIAVGIEDAGFELRDQIMWIYGSGFPKSRNVGDGWGTALKPAHEPIALARKPFKGTVEENMSAHCTGAINIDACRVESGNRPLVTSDRRLHNNTYSPGLGGSKCEGVTSIGRWPANLIHDGSDEVVSAFPNAPGQQGDLNETGRDRISKGRYGDMPPPVAHKARNDAGSAARFFYAAKASKKDRGEGNNHPTVKPTDLMAYLCRLVTPPNGIILDPFMGSGSTGKAALKEGFRFIGIEREKEYLDIAEARIRAALAAEDDL